MTVRTNDHRELISEVATSYTESAREERESEDGFDCLELNVMRSCNNDNVERVEFLLTCGGPTVRVSVNQWDNVEFYYSWGKDSDGDDCEAIHLHGEEGDFWVQLAEEMKECFPTVNK
mgnify:CR=1 FL=1|tara:strand:- start:3852 stop:4205 length:354 start_codon:yes stop_codon:yes gene_type:complete